MTTSEERRPTPGAGSGPDADLREMLDAIDAFVAIRRARGEPFVFSPSVERILGHAPGDLAVPGAWRALVHPDDLARLVEVWEGTDPSWELEYRVRRADDTWAWVRERGRRTSPGSAPEGGRIACLISDVTEDRRLREQVARSSRFEGLGRLAAGVAHDFDNVLYGIATLAGFLEGSVAEGPGRADVRAIVEATEHGRELTRRLLLLAGDARLAPTEVHPAEALGAARALVEPVLGESIVIDVAVDPGLAPVRVDRAGLERAIVDLVLNARDSMPRGGWITVAAERVAVGMREGAAAGIVPGAYVRISVADVGRGVAPDELVDLFDPFSPARAESIAMGLGLPLVHAFVRASGGGISVESEVGTGSTFRLYLPAGDQRP